MVNLRLPKLSCLKVSVAVLLTVGTTTAAYAAIPVSACPAPGCADLVVAPSGPVPPDKFAVEVVDAATTAPQLLELLVDPNDNTKQVEGPAVTQTTTPHSGNVSVIRPAMALLPDCNPGNRTTDASGTICAGYRLKYTVPATCTSVAADQRAKQADFQTTHDPAGAVSVPPSLGTLSPSAPIRVSSGQSSRTQQLDTAVTVTLAPSAEFSTLSNLERVTVTIAKENDPNELPVSNSLLTASSGQSVMIMAACDLTVQSVVLTNAGMMNACHDVVEVVPGNYTVKFSAHTVGQPAASDSPAVTQAVTLNCPPPTGTYSNGWSGCSLAPSSAGGGAAAVLVVGLAAVMIRRRRRGPAGRAS